MKVLLLTLIVTLLTVADCQSSGILNQLHGYQHLENELEKSVSVSYRDAIEENYIEQPLDHFDSNNTETWEMRYFSGGQGTCTSLNGPIYLFIGGIGEAIPIWLMTGLMYELAGETCGKTFMSEHRFYGMDSFDSDDFEFLNSEQALADLALLIKTIKLQPENKNSKVVVVGGSYAGNLAAWMRLLYPDLVDAALAISAPVLAKFDFYEFDETVGDDYKQLAGDSCYDQIHSTFKSYEEMFKTKDGIRKLKKQENICSWTDLSRPLNKKIFFLYKSLPYKVAALIGLIDAIKNCRGIDISSKDYLLSKENQTSASENDCIELDFSWHVNNDLGENPWFWQQCSEFGYFQTASSVSQPFTKNLDVQLAVEACKAAFGKEFDESYIRGRINAANKKYGGLHPMVTKVLFTNGDMDPWHRLGIVNDLSEDAPARLIPGTFHCDPLLGIENTDNEVLKKAIEYAKTTIKRWLGIDVIEEKHAI